MKKVFFTSKVINNAHRGYSAAYPENTFASIQAAVDAGADVIETDLRMTADGKVVLIHDESVERLADGSGKIAEMTYHDLSQLDFGYRFTLDKGKTFPFRGKGNGIVLFEEALRRFPDMRFNVDLKDNSLMLVDASIRIVQDQSAADRVLAGSFFEANVKSLRRKMPGIATACTSSEVLFLMFLSKTGLMPLKKTFAGDAVQIPEYAGGVRLITPSFVKDAHAKDLSVYVWTVNNEKDMIRLLSYGVDGIFTDDPALLNSVCHRK